MNVVISKSDVVTAYGWGMDALWDGLLSGQTAIETSDRFTERNFVSNQAAEIHGLKVEADGSRAMAMLTHLLAPLAGKLDPLTPLILATTVGEIEIVERAVLNEVADIADAQPHVLLLRIKTMLGLQGPAIVLSSACASSSAAVAHAAATVRRGEAPAVLVIAFDVISEFVYSGFSSLLSLSDSPAKPFDAARSGLSLGEAAAWALITAEKKPSADSVAILGWGSTGDAVHLTAPDRNAGGLSRAIAKACEMSGKKPDEISFIAAHGTATQYSDAMELLAFARAMAKPVPMFSIKGGMGHVLGAAGLVQLLVSQRALLTGTIPPTVGLSSPDADAVGWVRNAQLELRSPSVALSASAGFGGVNTVVILGKNSKTAPTLPASKPQIIRAAAWFCPEHCGAFAPGGAFFKTASPVITNIEPVAALIGRPVKNLGRMPAEARASLVTASLVLQAAGFHGKAPGEIGVLAAGYEGCMRANREYFWDYVAGGRSIGRGNLFIYTLPTSTLGEVAIALSLTGPTLHIHCEEHPVATLVSAANQLINDREADGILAIYSDNRASICLAIGSGDGRESFVGFDWDQTPLQIARSLAIRVPHT